MAIPTHPLQSPEWARFREKWGNEVVKTPYGYLTLHRLPFIPHKIAIFEKGPAPTKQMCQWLMDYGLQHKIIFIKLEPNIKKDIKTLKILSDSGAVPGKTLFTPTTFWIDLAGSEEELLKSFSSKTRYNIRLAQKHGVEVVEDNSDKAFEEYLKLTRETVTRQGFYAHTEKYHRLMWEELKKAGIAHLLVAKYNPPSHKASEGQDGEIITTWILFSYNGVLYYPYGASSEKYKFVMANNLMMWEAIRLGKSLDCKIFDLWGREIGKGFTKFKEGYNPEVVEFLGTWDLVINKPIYFVYRVLEAMRWFFLKTVKNKFIKPTF